MKIKRLKSKKNPLVIVTIILIVCLLGGVFYVYGLGGNLFGWTADTTGNNPGDSSSENRDEVDLTQPSDEQVKAGNDAKSDSVKNNLDEIDDDTTSNEVKVTVAAAINGDHLRVQTTIGKVTNQGACTLVLSKGNTSKKYSADVQALTDYSTCKGFSLPLTGLSSGTWNIDIKYSDGSVEGSGSTSIKI